MQLKKKHIRAAKQSPVAERLRLSLPAIFTISASSSPLAAAGADLLAAIDESMSACLEAAGECDSVGRQIENDWLYLRNLDVAAASLTRAVEKMTACIAASKKLDGEGQADAAIVKGCRDLSTQCKQLIARCAACKTLCETASKDDAQDKDIKESCAKVAGQCDAAASAAKNCGSECESMAAIGAKITAEAPLGNQAGIDTAAVGNSPDPKNGKPAGAAGKPPIPKFALSFYTGGTMMVSGFKMPVAINCHGVKCASDRFPVYANHIDENSTGPEIIEQLIGQTSGPSTVMQGCNLVASGEVTGTSETVKAVMAHADNGFQWQASIDAIPMKGHVIAEGDEEVINGKTMVGPVFVADEAMLANVAVVPLGADTSTQAHFAAANAARRSNMEFEAWLKAEYGMTAAEYAALEKDKPGQHSKIKARWDKVGNIAAGAAGAGTETAIRTPATAAAIRGAAAGASDPDVDLKAIRASRAAESRRIARLDQIQAQYAKVEVMVDGKAVKAADYIATAIEEGTEPDAVELVLLRASRKPVETGVGAPMIGTGRGQRRAGILGEYLGATPSRGGRHELPPTATILNDDYCRVIEAAGLISSGRDKHQRSWAEVLAKHPQYGERCVQIAEDEMSRHGHGLGPLGLMCMAARMGGMTDIPRNNIAAWDYIRDKSMRAEFTTFTLPVILSNLQNKWLLDGYYAVDPNAGVGGGVAWQQVARRGNVQDFKPHYRLRRIGNFRPKSLGEGGEIQHAQIGEESYQIQAKVKALMDGISYQAIINDDLNSFSTIPTDAGVGCGEQVARDFYTAFMANLQSDGTTAFFSKTDRLSAANIRALNAFALNWNAGATYALSVSGLSLAFGQFLNQVKPNGEPFGELPAVLLAPVGLAITANQLYQDSQLIPALQAASGPTAQFGVNPHKGLYRPVVSQYLSNATITGNSTSTWYLTTAPTSSNYAVEIAFLNGQEMPIIERDDMAFDRLGIAMRWWLSYGVGMGNPRAAQRNDIA